MQCVWSQVEPKRYTLLGEKAAWENELRKTKGQYYYLQSLEKVRVYVHLCSCRKNPSVYCVVCTLLLETWFWVNLN